MSAYNDGAEDMRSAIIRRFRELEREWISLRDGYDPHGQWDDREVARREIEGYRTAIGVAKGVVLEGVPQTQEPTRGAQTTAPDEPY